MSTSKTTKKKLVEHEVMNELVLPTDDYVVVRAASSRGNNLHEVQTPDGSCYLASIPTKFRRNIWIKRGDFLLVTPISEGDKVKAEVTHVLYKPQIKHIVEHNLWPEAFHCHLEKLRVVKPAREEPQIPDDMLPPSEDSSDEESDDEAPKGEVTNNPNRRGPAQVTWSASDSEDEDQPQTEPRSPGAGEIQRHHGKSADTQDRKQSPHRDVTYAVSCL